MIVELHHLICRGLVVRREPRTSPDCALFDTRGEYWVGFDDRAGHRVWSAGPTLDQARDNALDAFQERTGATDKNPVLIAQETRIAPDGQYWFEPLPFVPHAEGPQLFKGQQKTPCTIETHAPEGTTWH